MSKQSGSKKKLDTPSPREYLVSRRPERFSDSSPVQTPELDRSILEYHLSTITNHSQESDFARFCHRLAQAEICPNLLPQTGPTGGGDSKTDAETFPVAEELALLWFEGEQGASKERWAFAFSAKEKWRDKVQSDVSKIVSTGRGYTNAFFISSHFIKDKDRADEEDKLRKKHSLDIRILDRSWILDRVFQGGHEKLAISELRIPVKTQTQVRKGPRDFRREQELEELESRIVRATEDGTFGLPLVDDCLEAASLCRSLDRPRTLVEGMYLRAIRSAGKYGTSHQHLVANYQWAWTLMFWFEDYKEFIKVYAQVEALARGSLNAYDLELLATLWTTLSSAVRMKLIDQKDVDLGTHRSVLQGELKRLLSQAGDRPSTALQARTQLLHIELLDSMWDSEPDRLDTVLGELRDVVLSCSGLVGYPLEPLAEIIMEIGNLLGLRDSYAMLFEAVADVTSRRKGEVSAARLVLRRGSQLLENGEAYEAIRTLGRAFGKLFKYESRELAVQALYLCGCAYEKVGLLWAARGTLLMAASLASNEFWTYSEVTPPQAACYHRLKWVELQLGRLPHVLAWHEVDRVVTSVLINRGYVPSGEERVEDLFQVILSYLIMREDLWAVGKLSRLPDALKSLDLDLVADALLHALGHEVEGDPDDLAASREKLRSSFDSLRMKAPREELPQRLDLCDERTLKMSSRLLGCTVLVKSENLKNCTDVSESLLSALEALLATGVCDRMVAREPLVTINVRQSDFCRPPVVWKRSLVDGHPHWDISCQRFEAPEVEVQQNMKQAIRDLIADVLPRVFVFPDIEGTLTRLLRDDVGLERSLSFTGSLVHLTNVLGQSPKTTIEHWWQSAAFAEYPLRRNDWRAPVPSVAAPAETADEPDEPKSGADAPDFSKSRHKDMRTVSVIREALWDVAKWHAVVYLTGPGMIPSMLLTFKNEQASIEIFSLWRKELGEEDSDGGLRITIVRGIDQREPHAYRVIVGPEIGSQPCRESGLLVIVSRVHTMYPQSPENLSRFLAAYGEVGRYRLGLAVWLEEKLKILPESMWLSKRQLHIRNAWEIGVDDTDSVGVKTSDQPVIPHDKQENAPVLELLRFKRSRSREE